MTTTHSQLPSAFDAGQVQKMIDRINGLTPEHKPQWGKMDAAQVLAHLCVTYEMLYENKHPKPNSVAKFLLKMFVKQSVVGEKPYKNNSPTAPAFVMKSGKDFEVEKTRLIGYVKHTLELGEAHFEGRESHSFGVLSAKEYNIMFSKHLDHHLRQFGV